MKASYLQSLHSFLYQRASSQICFVKTAQVRLMHKKFSPSWKLLPQRMMEAQGGLLELCPGRGELPLKGWTLEASRAYLFLSRFVASVNRFISASAFSARSSSSFTSFSSSCSSFSFSVLFCRQLADLKSSSGRIARPPATDAGKLENHLCQANFQGIQNK